MAKKDILEQMDRLERALVIIDDKRRALLARVEKLEKALTRLDK